MAEGRTTWPPVKDGWFVEPSQCTAFLLALEPFDGGIWDPACGQGNIVKACLLAGKIAVGTDLVDRVTTRTRAGGAQTPDWFYGTCDFIAAPIVRPLQPNLVCNPPYGRALLAEAFIRRACGLPGVRKVAMFLNSKFMYGGARAAGLYRELPPDRIYPVNPRPSCPPGEFLRAGGKAEGGVENFMWAVWSIAAPTGRSEIIWNGAGERHLGPPKPDAPPAAAGI